MRRPEPLPFRVIIPIHVARQLANVERTTAAALQEALETIAGDFARNPPGWSEPRPQALTLNGTTIEYECDPRNGALVAMNLVGSR